MTRQLLLTIAVVSPLAAAAATLTFFLGLPGLGPISGAVAGALGALFVDAVLMRRTP